jgi:hypothetical protein
LGKPVEEEKRTVTGVEGWLKCGAVVRLEDVALGVKVPVRRWPFAWARCVSAGSNRDKEVGIFEVMHHGGTRRRVKQGEDRQETTYLV